VPQLLPRVRRDMLCRQPGSIQMALLPRVRRDITEGLSGGVGKTALPRVREDKTRAGTRWGVCSVLPARAKFYRQAPGPA